MHACILVSDHVCLIEMCVTNVCCIWCFYYLPEILFDTLDNFIHSVISNILGGWPFNSTDFQGALHNIN